MSAPPSSRAGAAAGGSVSKRKVANGIDI